MRFGVILASFSVTGVPKVQLRLAGELARRGHQVDLVVGRPDGAIEDQAPQGVDVLHLNASRAALALPRLAAYLHRERPDAVLSAEDHINVVVLAAAALVRSESKVCVTTHVPLFQRNRRAWSKHRWILRLTSRLYPRADCVGAVSAGLADELASVIGLPRDDVATLYNPIVTEDAERALAAPCPHDWLLGDSPVVCACASLTPRKRIGDLLEAFARVRPETNARLIVLGDGPERANLERRARELDIASHVDFVGVVPNPYVFMTRASLFVLSSAFEGLPGVLVEALACGTPVVSTDCPHGPREILAGGRYGRLVPVGDVEGLATAMRDTLRDPPEAPQLRSRAREFSAKRSVDRYLSALGISIDG